MPRIRRENLEGGTYHVFARGNAKAHIYLDDADRRLYLHLLGTVIDGNKWLCLAYCLMHNHVHLLLETPLANLSAGMQRLHGRYAQRFNARYERCGHVFQGRYGAKLVTSDSQLYTVARYIAQNPVEAKLCERPEEWPWSSFSDAVQAMPPSWLNATDLARILRRV